MNHADNIYCERTQVFFFSDGQRATHEWVRLWNRRADMVQQTNYLCFNIRDIFNIHFYVFEF